jgi:hypothetical protein
VSEYTTAEGRLGAVKEQHQWKSGGHCLCGLPYPCDTVFVLGLLDSLQAERDALAQKVADMEEAAEEETREFDKTLAERDYWVEKIDAIADALGDETEWTSSNDRDQSAEKLAKHLRVRVKELEEVLRREQGSQGIRASNG